MYWKKSSRMLTERCAEFKLFHYDVLDEDKLSESATALATARGTTSDDEDGSTQGNKKSSIHSNTQGTHSELFTEIDNLGAEASNVTVPSGHHGDETRDGRCGTRVSSVDGSRTSEGHDDVVLQDEIDTKKEVVDIKDDSTSKLTDEVSGNGETTARQTHLQKLEKTLDEPTQNAVATGDNPREVIADILIQPKAARVTYHESVSDHDEENQMQNEDPILEEEYLLKCLYCETTSTRSTLLRDHMRNQHPDKPIRYQCPKCEQTFLLKSHLDKHLAMHSPTSQSCKVCQKTFANVYRLQRHMISHSESTDLRKFKCPECGKAFKFKHHLKEHIRIHSGEKPFQCPTCNKRFSHSGSYSSHMTSKKCWVIGQSKGQGRRQERQMEPGAYPQQLLKFDQPPPPAATLRQQFFCNPPISTAIINSAQNAFAFGLYQQKLSGTSSSLASSTVPPVPAHVHQHTNIPFHMMSSTHSIPDAHVSHRAIQEQLKKSPALVDALMAGHYRSDSRPAASNPTAESSNISMPTPSPSPCGLQSSPADNKDRGSDIAERMLLNLDQNGRYTADLMKLLHKQKLDMKEEVNDKMQDVKEEVLSEEEDENLQSSEATKEVKAESACEDISDLIVAEVKLEMKPDGHGDLQVCRYCHQQFTSPVDLHQHERYLCKDNHDIKKVISDCRTLMDKCKEDDPSLKAELDRSSPVSSKLSDDETEDMEDEDEEDEDDDIIGDGNKSSKLTENQAQHLRNCFRDNKKPSDHAMEEIAKIIGASKKMVQIWFQSARSREKRKSQCKSKSTFHKIPNKRCSIAASSATSPSSYIPIVPNPFAVLGKRYQKSNSAPLNYPSTGPLTPPSDDQPLDLSVRKQTPPKAHENHPIQLKSMDNFQDQVLNLSNKVPKLESVSPSLSVKIESPKSSSTPRCLSQESTPKCYSSSLPLSIPNFLHIPDPHKQFAHPVVMVTDLDAASKHLDARFQHSEIFKYMSQKGLFKSGFPTILDPSTSRKFSPTLLNSNVLAQITGVIPPNNHHPQRESPVKINSAISMDTAINKNNDKLPSSPIIHKLIIDESLEENSTKVSSLEGEMKRYMEGQGNLQTLASVASLEEFRAAADAEGKRKRKKSSKQVEAEEIKMEDLEDSVSNTDDDSASPRKRRRSWKGHRMSEELGMYACDQCDKQFSKQSSLARHKYEHSGARPFNCEVCSKAFKHKHHLTEHRRLHSGEKPFKCRKCGKRFSHSGSYSQHMNHRYKFCKPSDGEDEDAAIVSSKED